MPQKWSNTEILLEVRKNSDYPFAQGKALRNTLAIKAVYSYEICILIEVSFFLEENVNHSVVSNSLQPHGLYSPWNSPGQDTGVRSLSLLQRMKIPTLQVDSLPSEPQGKPKNTGVGSLSLIQLIFLT